MRYKILTSLSLWQVRTHFAKPNWKKVMSKIGSKHANARIGKLADFSQFFFMSKLLGLNLFV